MSRVIVANANSLHINIKRNGSYFITHDAGIGHGQMPASSCKGNDKVMEMGEHAKTALWLGAGVFIFIICLSSASYLFQTTSDMNSKMYTLIGTTDPNQKATLKIEHHYTSTGAEVMQTLHQIKELDANC